MVLLDGTSSHPRELLGNKGHGIEVMRRHHLPVPPAFCLTTAVGLRYLADPAATMDAVWDDVLDRIGWLQAQTSRTFGRGPHPLLVSVRSGATQSMPGMMDTLLNLGINDSVEQALAAEHGPAFARDTHRRFREMYRRIVGVERPVPSDPYTQLRAGIEAVFASWNSPRARAYRAHYGFADRHGTAVVVQAMVFGNHGPNSGAGAFFSRNPITGDDEPFGEWLPGGQGDDVVSGSVDVEPIAALRDEQPAVYDQLMAAARTLERLDRDVQEIEFTVEDGALWLLQTRAAERSAQAAVRSALQLRREGLIDDAETLRRVTPAHVRSLLMPALQPEIRLAAPLLAKGLPACPGVVSGTAYADVDEALHAAERGEPVILVRDHTRPEDVSGMLAARGDRHRGGRRGQPCGGGQPGTGPGGRGGLRRRGGRDAGGPADHRRRRRRRSARRRIVPVRMVRERYPGAAGAGRDRAADQPAARPFRRRPSAAGRRLRERRARGPGRRADRRGLAHPAAGHADRAAPGRAVTELAVLQAIRLKGRVSRADLAATLGTDPDEIAGTVERLSAAGLVTGDATLWITPAGSARLTALLAEERRGIDAAAMAAVYDDFRAINADFKRLVTDWQLKDGAPNRHDDAEYDDAVLARLDDAHARVTPVIEAAAAQLPRLNRYAAKLAAALDKVRAGDTAWLTRPLIDSYHTVWFELHEELIVAVGLTRQEAARSGDAQ